jgi:hypothetical protein
MRRSGGPGPAEGSNRFNFAQYFVEMNVDAPIGRYRSFVHPGEYEEVKFCGPKVKREGRPLRPSRLQFSHSQPRTS